MPDMKILARTRAPLLALAMGIAASAASAVTPAPAPNSIDYAVQSDFAITDGVAFAVQEGSDKLYFASFPVPASPAPIPFSFNTGHAGPVDATLLLGLSSLDDGETHLVLGLNQSIDAEGLSFGDVFPDANESDLITALTTLHLNHHDADATNEIFDFANSFSRATFTPPADFNLYAFSDGRLIGTGTSDQTNPPVLPGPAVPEPASWAMMIVGFGAAGAAMRRRVRVSKVSFSG